MWNVEKLPPQLVGRLTLVDTPMIRPRNDHIRKQVQRHKRYADHLHILVCSAIDSNMQMHEHIVCPARPDSFDSQARIARYTLNVSPQMRRPPNTGRTLRRRQRQLWMNPQNTGTSLHILAVCLFSPTCPATGIPRLSVRNRPSEI
jgi:hypothetical protein